jgi:YVTN family beta-propeller protein
VYAVNQGDNTVSVIDTATNSVIDTVGVGSLPRGVAVSSDGTIYVMNTGSNTVSVIDPLTNTVVAEISGVGWEGVFAPPDIDVGPVPEPAPEPATAVPALPAWAALLLGMLLVGTAALQTRLGLSVPGPRR